MNSGFGMFKLFYTLPNVELNLFLLSTGLIILYGIIWLAPFLPPILKNRWLWAVFFGSILIGTAAVSFIQVPLQLTLDGPLTRAFSGIFNEITIMCVVGIIMSLISALIQEGAKLTPVVLYWWRKKKDINPTFGLILGAVAGAALGMIETFLGQNQLLEIGLDNLLKNGMLFTVSIFLVRFFSIAFHTGATAIAGYGLASGKGWQFYLIICAVHLIYDYVTVLLSAKVISFALAEILLYFIAILVMAYALWLRWRKREQKT